MNIKYLLIISLLSTYQFITCSDQELTSQPEELVRQNEEFITWSISGQKPLVKFYNSLHQDDPEIPYLQDIVRSNLEYYGEYDIVWPKLFDHATYIAIHKDAYDLHNSDLYIYDHPNFKPVVQENNYEVVLNPEENDDKVDDMNLTEDQLATYNYIIENHKYLIEGFQLVSNNKFNTQTSFEFFLKKAILQEDFDLGTTIHTAQQYIAERMEQQFLTILEYAIKNNVQLSQIDDSIFLYVTSHQHGFMKHFLCTWIKDTYHLDKYFDLFYKDQNSPTFKIFEDSLSQPQCDIIRLIIRSKSYIAKNIEPLFFAIVERLKNTEKSLYPISPDNESIKKTPLFSYTMSLQNNFMKDLMQAWIREIPEITTFTKPSLYEKTIQKKDADAFLLLLYIQDNYANNADKNILKKRDFLRSAINAGCPDIVALLLDSKNININQQDANGRNPLITAVQSENLEIVSLLLDVSGINTELCNKAQQTPLSIAITKNNPAMVKVLLDAGADHNAIVNNETLLAIATRRGFTKIVEILTQAANSA